MPKFFMYGSELQELEQLMMLVPNFLPRRSGVIVVYKQKGRFFLLFKDTSFSKSTSIN